MKSKSSWKPTKYISFPDGTLHASRSTTFVSPASRLNVELLGRRLTNMVRSFASGRLLDLGCGQVPLYAAYKDLVDEIVCVDWPTSDHGIDHVDVTCDINQPLPFSDSSFNSIVFTDVLEHLQYPEQATREIARILCAGGYLIGTVPFMYCLHEQPHDNYRFTEHALFRLAQQHHFEVVELSPYGVGTDVLFDLLGKLCVDRHWRFGPWMAHVAQRLGLALHNRRTESQTKRWRHIPLGYAFVWQRRP